MTRDEVAVFKRHLDFERMIVNADFSGGEEASRLLDEIGKRMRARVDARGIGDRWEGGAFVHVWPRRFFPCVWDTRGSHCGFGEFSGCHCAVIEYPEGKVCIHRLSKGELPDGPNPRPNVFTPSGDRLTCCHCKQCKARLLTEPPEEIVLYDFSKPPQLSSLLAFGTAQPKIAVGPSRGPRRIRGAMITPGDLAPMKFANPGGDAGWWVRGHIDQAQFLDAVYGSFRPGHGLSREEVGLLLYVNHEYLRKATKEEARRGWDGWWFYCDPEALGAFPVTYAAIATRAAKANS